MSTKDVNVNQFDFFIYGLDWISVINDGISYQEMLFLLDKHGISFTERYYMNSKYVVIGKNIENYRNLILLFGSIKDIRITRLDFKLDYKNDFEDVVVQRIANWEPHSSVSQKGKLQTLYFNSRQSDLFCRLYNKQAESDLPFPLTRLEYEIKGQLAYEFSKRLSYIGFEDALSFLFDKINEFNQRKHLTDLFYMTTKDYLPLDFIESFSVKNKFRRFVRHNKNSYSYYMDYFRIGPEELDDIMTGVTDINEFLETH